MLNTLVIIPARGGSKGIPHKNIKLLGGKPLIWYSIAVARTVFKDEDICVSTDDEEIKRLVEETGLQVPFLRPAALATDESGTNEVLLHALDHYAAQGRYYDQILLLQPTSPFRKRQQILDILAMKRPETEMIVGVKETEANPYYVLFEEDRQGVLRKVKESQFSRRQDCPVIWEVNGAFYLIDISRLRQKGNLAALEKHKFEMDAVSSIDIDTPMDWAFAEFILTAKMYDDYL